MYYCFIREDIECLNEHDPLNIQKRYANRINKLLLCNIEKGIVTDKELNSISIKGEKILLRGTCENYETAEKILSKAGGTLVETKENIDYIEAWYEHIKPIRDIYRIKASDLFDGKFDEKILTFLKSKNSVFIKTKKKGFSICLPTEKIFNKDAEFYRIISQLKQSDEILISNYYSINIDSYGKKEARFFVFNNEIKNCSRPLHSVKHTVSKKFKERAEEIVEKISCRNGFPLNYVLDIGEFIENDEKFIDIIEINPITCSLCYINNSIFDSGVPEIMECVLRFGAGYEYCYDLLSNPAKYVFRKSVGESFEYINETQYNLL